MHAGEGVTGSGGAESRPSSALRGTAPTGEPGPHTGWPAADHAASAPEPDRRASREQAYADFSEVALQRRRLRRASLAVALALVGAVRALRRPLDALVALAALLVASPVFVPLTIGLLLLRPGHRVWHRELRLGRFCEPFELLAFDAGHGRAGQLLDRLGIAHWPALLNIVRGDMAWIGPRAALPGELSPRDRIVRRRYDIRPGVIGPWWIRQRANIDYGLEAEADFEYVEGQRLAGDLGIALRALPALVYGGRPADVEYRSVVEMLGARIDNLTMGEAVDAIVERLAHGPPSQVCFVNADCLNIAHGNKAYLATLNDAWLTLADGIGVKLAGRLLRQQVKQNVNGTDLFPRLCESLAGHAHSVFLLGARPGVAEDVAGWIARTRPGVTVCGTQHGFFAPEEAPAVVRRVRECRADLLLVALGAPRQDTWLAEHLAETGARVGMGVGGLFDFYAGRIPRAPQWMRELALEWLYRFAHEPGRLWRRYLVGNTVFVARVMASRRRAGAPSQRS